MLWSSGPGQFLGSSVIHWVRGLLPDLGETPFMGIHVTTELDFFGFPLKNHKTFGLLSHGTSAGHKLFT